MGKFPLKAQLKGIKKLSNFYCQLSKCLRQKFFIKLTFIKAL